MAVILTQNQTHNSCCIHPALQQYNSAVQCTDLHGDGDCVMATNVAELPRGWNKIVLDSRGNVAPFNFYGALAASEMVFKLVRDVRCEFSDTD